MLDMCTPCGPDGLINIRVGAIIIKHGKLLMVKSEYSDYLFSVGGHLDFGETSEEAVIRETEEETGVRLEVDRLGFVHESYYRGESPFKKGKLVFEISFYYYMKVPDDFEPANRVFYEGSSRDELVWVEPDDPRRMFPTFFRDAIWNPTPGVEHLVSRS